MKILLCAAVLAGAVATHAAGAVAPASGYRLALVAKALGRDTPYVLFGNSQPPAGDLITFHIYNASFLTWNFGSGAAMSVLLLIFLMIVTGAYLIVTGRRSRRA